MLFFLIFYPSLGVLVEGFGVLLNGVCGTGIGVTSYGDNISMIAITKVTKSPTIQFDNSYCKCYY